MKRNQGEGDFQQSMVYHRREWRLQRLGWLVMALFMVAALAGLFGGGPLSKTQVADGRGQSVEYQRYTRKAGMSVLIVQAGIAVLAGDELRVSLPASYLERFAVESIAPEPDDTIIQADEVIFVFKETSAPARIVFRLKPETIGSAAAVIRIGAGEGIPIRQFIYP